MKTYPSPNKSTPLPSDANWLKKFNTAVRDPDPRIQANLSKQMQLSYRSGVGKLIWAMLTCWPDLAYTSNKLSQLNACPDEIHYHGFKHALKFCTTCAMTAYTSGRRHLVLSFRKAHHPTSTAIGPTSSLTTAHNLMHSLLMHTQTPIGSPVPTHNNHLAVSAYGLLAEP
jgi:hypothetical protein